MPIPMFVYVLSVGDYEDAEIVGIFTYDKIRQAIKDTRKYIRDNDIWCGHLSVKKIAFNVMANKPY
jgi:hypothetical protein